MLPFYRPKRAELTWRRLWPALALGVVLAAMNLSFYEAVGRLGLGIAATIEFLGPFALALAGSRRCSMWSARSSPRRASCCSPAPRAPSTRSACVLALTAAAAWAAYILLTRRVATRGCRASKG